MPDETTEEQRRDVVLGHFASYRMTRDFWALDAAERRERALSWVQGIADVAEMAEVYLTQGVESSADVLLWTSARMAEPEDAGAFFSRRASAESSHRAFFTPEDVLWGLTRPSEYSKARSAQEIDPFDEGRTPYLIAYPFAKTAEWYVLGRDARQGMMNEHIRIGKRFREIKQLLLYSFGLQDQEFVVVYETHDLSLFSKLVHDLRSTEARRFTQRDAPLHTGIRMLPSAWAETLG